MQPKSDNSALGWLLWKNTTIKPIQTNNPIQPSNPFKQNSKCNYCNEQGYLCYNFATLHFAQDPCNGGFAPFDPPTAKAPFLDGQLVNSLATKKVKQKQKPTRVR